MAIVDWNCPFTVESTYGTIDLNDATGDRYLLDPTQCASGADLRVTIDNIPSGDGAIMHDVFTGGYGINFMLSFWIDDNPACGSDLVRMWDALNFHLNAMRHTTGRVFYTPTGHAERLLDDVRLTQRGIIGYDGQGVLATVGFDFVSPFPYTINATQVVTNVLAGATHTFVNAGTADFYPVVKVHGPTSGGFIITNHTTNLSLTFDPALPGASEIAAGHYVELDFFRNTAYLDGNQANEKKGIDISISDFFPITVEPLGNVIGLAGGVSMDVLWQAAFA